MGRPPFSLLIKPASADCNLCCEYCFYLEKSLLYPDEARHRMSDAVLDRVISTYMATAQPVYSFGWQGGEPTLMGAGFFQRVVELQMAHGTKGAVVANGLQTNALSIDDEMARHFARYKFLLGVSLDGLEDMHDVYRRTAGGGPSHARVLARAALLRRNDVDFNILATVHAKNVARPVELYRYLVDSGFLFHQYIPIVEFDPNGEPLAFTISGRQWGEFLCAIFDEWIKADVTRVSIRDFDAILAFLVDGNRQICTMSDNCCQYLLVEYNGDVYPCDFFVRSDTRLGNIMETGWEELLDSPVYRSFGDRKGLMHPGCRECEFHDLCMGDCQKQRYYGGEDPGRQSWLCEGWKMFYAHSLSRFRRLGRAVLRERSRQLRQAANSPG